MSRKINAAIIGTGIGLKHLESIEGYRNSLVKIICEKDKKKIKFLKKKFPKKLITNNLEAIFKDKTINLITIASYDDTHYQYIMKCIRHNKNIIVEKPMCLSLSQLKKINASLKKNKKVKITSNLVLRVNDLFLKIKKSLNTNKIFYIEADYLWGRKYKLSGWRSSIKNYSITLGAAIHMIDLVMWLLQMRPRSVKAYASKKDTKNTTFKNNSFIIYILEFPGNIIVKISANLSGSFNHFHELKIFQKDKTFYHSIAGTYTFETNKKNLKKKIFLSKYPDKNNRKFLTRNFIDNLLGKSKIETISFKEQIDLMTVCFYADKSIKYKQKIKINYLK